MGGMRLKVLLLLLLLLLVMLVHSVLHDLL